MPPSVALRVARLVGFLDRPMTGVRSVSRLLLERTHQAGGGGGRHVGVDKQGVVACGLSEELVQIRRELPSG